MKTYFEIQAEIQRLQAKAEQLRDAEKASVVERIREAIKVYGITAADLGFSQRPGGQASVKATGRRAGLARYRDPATGRTWTGVGKPPQWIAGKDRVAFEIGGSPAQSASTPARGRQRASRSKLKDVGVPKYRDGASGKTWTGRGKPPNWIVSAKNRDDFLIKG